MKTTVKHLSDTKVQVSFELGKPELDAAEQVALKKLSKDIKVKGFRKGHVPLEVVAKNVDPNLLSQQALEDAISKAVAEGFIAEQIQVLERPEVEVKEYVPGESVKFTAEADVLPKVKLGAYDKLKYATPEVKVDKKDVEDVIERMRSSMSAKQPVEREAKDGDEAVIDFVGKKDGEPFEGGAGNDYPLTLGSNSFIPGFEEGIVGHKADDKFDLELKFPDEYHSKDLAGQKVVFETTLKSVNEVVLPELNDEFAAKTGPFTSMDELRADISKELTAQKQREEDDRAKDDLVRQLVESSTVPAPDILVKDQQQSIQQDLVQNLMYSGMSLEQYLEGKGFKDREDWEAKELRPAAENRVKAGLVLAELSKALNIQSDSEELAARINEYKKQYANNPEMLKRFDEPEVHRDIANRLLTEKTVDKLVELNHKPAKKPAAKKK